MSSRSAPGKVEQDLGALIDSIDLSDVQMQFMRGRWLDQVVWMGAAANRARRRYYALRLVTVLGAVLVPALVSLNLAGDAGATVDWLAFSVSLLVAACAAVDGFFQFGTVWRHYRARVELLKSEGWSFAQLSGPYRRPKATHASAFPSFVTRIETAIGQEVEEFISRVAREPGESDQDEDA
jgi:hypothetical protein